MVVQFQKEVFEKFDEKINQISRLPKSCPESKEEPRLYKGVVEKHISFVYRINQDFIDVLFIFDNRESPEGIKEIISKAHNTR